MSASLPSWARVGAKVVFVGGPPGCYTGNGEIVPEIGCVYTIREVLAVGGRGQCRLVEIHNAPRDYSDYGWDECTFGLRAFRPAVEPKSEAHDVALFTHHLDELYVAMRNDDIVADA